MPHIIQKQVIDLELPPNSFGGGIETEVRDLFYRALPKVEGVFDNFDNKNGLIRIDHIYIDLGRFDPSEMEDSFSARLCEALTRAFKSQLPHATDNMHPRITGRKVPGLKSSSFNGLTEDKGDGENYTVRMKVSAQTKTEQALEDAFLYFLEYGALPWWLTEQARETPEAIFRTSLMKPSHDFAERLRSLLFREENAVRRLFIQFSNKFRIQIEQLLENYADEEVKKIYTAVRTHGLRLVRKYHDNSSGSQQKCNQLLLEILVAENPLQAITRWINELISVLESRASAEILLELSRKVFFAASQVPFMLVVDDVVSRITGNSYNSFGARNITKITDPDTGVGLSVPVGSEIQPDKTSEPLEDFIYADYAGLVIIHPYLSHLFTGLNLLDKNEQFVDRDAQTKAVNLLAFIASGETMLPEYKLQFCKFLCGLELRSALDNRMILTGEEINECEALLDAVITHWTALKNTSPEGLRDGFLARKGKLDFREEMPVLYMETMSHDILLDFLPWAISYIKLPWINKPFTTMWI